MIKQTLLDEATLEMLKFRRDDGSAAKESLEYQIRLRRALGKELHLPDTLESARYLTFRLSVVDKQVALHHVYRHIHDVDRLVEILR